VVKGNIFFRSPKIIKNRTNTYTRYTALPHTSDAGKGLGGGATADARPHGRRRRLEHSALAARQALAAVSWGPPQEAPPRRALGHGGQQSSRRRLQPRYTTSPNAAWSHDLAPVRQSAARPSGQRSGARLGTGSDLEVAAPIQSRKTTQGWRGSRLIKEGLWVDFVNP
jgi:hypothetical protein